MASSKNKLANREGPFWRESFAAAAHGAAHPRYRSPTRAAAYCADFADKAVEQYRQRVLWRARP